MLGKSLESSFSHPYRKREIYYHGLRWSPSNKSLPMSLSCGRLTQVIVGLVFFPFGLLLGGMGIGVLIFSMQEANFILLLVGLGFGLLSFLCIRYCIARILSNSILTICSERVVFTTKFLGKSDSWEEPLSNYVGVGIYFIAGRYGKCWEVVLFHRNRSKAFPLERFSGYMLRETVEEIRDKKVLPAAERIADMLGVPFVGVMDSV